jgi:hypothetical protein
MRNELLAAFEDQVAELKEQLPELTGECRLNAMAQLESLTEFLELIELIGGRRAQPAAHHEIVAGSND